MADKCPVCGTRTFTFDDLVRHQMRSGHYPEASNTAREENDRG